SFELRFGGQVHHVAWNLGRGRCVVVGSDAGRSMAVITDQPIRRETLNRQRWWTRFTRWLARGEPQPRGAAHLFVPAGEHRSLELLKSHLSRRQLEQYERDGSFDVVGGDTGRLYRVVHGRQMNVQILDKRGEWIASLFFLPVGYLPIGDVLLAQKIAL